MKKLAIPFLMLLSSVGLPVLGAFVAPAAAAAQDRGGERRAVQVVPAPQYGYAPQGGYAPQYAQSRAVFVGQDRDDRGRFDRDDRGGRDGDRGDRGGDRGGWDRGDRGGDRGGSDRGDHGGERGRGHWGR